MSLIHLNSIDYPAFNYTITTDLAFYLNKKYGHLFKPRYSSSISSIAMNFRNWRNKKTSKEIIEKAIIIVKYLINNYDVSISFISTCQGIKDYKDDSIVSYSIYESLSNDEKEKVFVGIQEIIPQKI